MAADSGAGQLQNDLDVADTRVARTGQLDLATVQVLRGAAAVLMSETAHEISIDLGRLQFIDAAGLGEVGRLRMTLIAAARRFDPVQTVFPDPPNLRHGPIGRADLAVTGTDRVTEMKLSGFLRSAAVLEQLNHTDAVEGHPDVLVSRGFEF